MSGTFLIADISGTDVLKQHQCSYSGMDNVFSLSQRMKGNMDLHSLLYKLFL